MSRVVMIAVALTVLASPALAQSRPKSVGKVVGPCPIGYRYATGSCAPRNQRSGVAFVKKGACPIGWSHSGAYCLRTSRWAHIHSLDAARQHRSRRLGQLLPL